MAAYIEPSLRLPAGRRQADVTVGKFDAQNFFPCHLRYPLYACHKYVFDRAVAEAPKAKGKGER